MSDKPLTIFNHENMDQTAIDQIVFLMQDERAVKGAIMADGHLGYSMPIGGVIAYEDAISPSGVGFDIGCGNAAVKTNLMAEDVFGWDGTSGMAILHGLLREIQRTVAFGMGRKNPTPIDAAIFYSDTWDWLEPTMPGLLAKARDQLGTVGSGNHYVDLLVDSSGFIWVANHFGSRGLGHTIATHFLNLGKAEGHARFATGDEAAVVLPTDKDIGRFYIEAMELALDYAYEGRRYVIDQVLGILGVQGEEWVENHHNYAAYENGLWVVRKGATPLTAAPAFIGGSMGDNSAIVTGVTTELWSDDPSRIGALSPRIQDIGNIASAPHGAGRVMSRTAAAGKLRKMWVCPNRNCDFVPERCSTPDSGYPSNHCPKCEIPLRRERVRDKSTAAIDWDTVRANLTDRGIVVLGGGADEAPGVYKDLGYVLASHQNIAVLETLTPIGVVMAGSDERDPYAD